ncbi:MAG: hypothetical protein ABI972_07055 [Acidobacteriota bacterium]
MSNPKSGSSASDVLLLVKLLAAADGILALFWFVDRHVSGG